MNKKINLPKDIKQGTTILVRDNDYDEWLTKVFVCTYNNKVYVKSSAFQDSLIPYLQAKMPEIDWNKIPIDTELQCWNNDDTEYIADQYFIMCIEGIPFTSDIKRADFIKEKEAGNYVELYSWDNIEIL